MLFFISSKFGANKMRIKCCCHSKSAHKLPPKRWLDHAEHQPRHKEGYNNVETLRTEEGVEDIAVFARNDILQACVHTDTYKCQREEEGREGLCHRCLGEFFRLPIGEDVVALQQAEH